MKANKGSAGIGDMSFEKFEKMNTNLYKIWNRMSLGNYFSSTAMAVEIPSKSGEISQLDIPTIADWITQTITRAYVDWVVEPMFCIDLYYMDIDYTNLY